MFEMIGVGLAAAGLVTSFLGGSAAEDAQKLQRQLSRKIGKESKKLEELRREQAATDFAREQRNIIRQAQIARSAALTTATAQGAGAAGGSTLAGAQADITSQEARGISGLATNFRLGSQAFDINATISELNRKLAIAGGQVQAAGQQVDFGRGLFSTGANIVQNAPQLQNVVSNIRNIF